MAVHLSVPEFLLPIKGIRLATINAGIRYKNRDDMVLIEAAEGSSVAAVFTRNAFCAAPVTVARAHLAQAPIRYLMINAGNANAGTGSEGLAAATTTCEALAQVAGVNTNQVLPFSTGVIGVQLPVAKVTSALPELVASLTEDNWMKAARAIMTTDTLPKGISKQVSIGGQTITITGIAKGAGMIHPNMATMLSYIATDAQVEASFLQQTLSSVVDDTFNCITIDGDTSTNDALVLIATGASGVAVGENELATFHAALKEVCLFLAQAIVRDGEGATKFIDVQVEQARSREEAHTVANTVALSPLVKTALFASDPNWGRILAAVGRSPIDSLDVSRISIYLGDTLLVKGGQPSPDYTEAQGQAETKKDEIKIRISLGRGDAVANVWTCDFSFDYVKINAEYRS
ncbi:MAG: bifunctional glutamate N-acetyltransferase/amino-acid acetyltransferase ArgJ [Thiofilum sp.]|uniref:bifunctional glutamate N-acetyltransferase/amino-acid acetyltransferase ArgJ n=1 Tax=Thiofilum sp. TaxID=2212733 RepID=UPI0025F733D6|nr:bifunctional glutamate N-acetyltransferase/amino-acid acetyltransferase ArgJ [Thiofilum sp.]MBK8453220.1 bifunctional glutamate N-acetyltransferase/amino-acid acetyltransferase ArgJ [Thiofilum sp.]